VSRLTLRTGRRSFSLMLQFYDKALAASVLALAALASPTSADTGDPARVPACNLSDGYGTELIAFVREASACLDTPVSAAGEAMADDVHVLSNRIREKAGGKRAARAAIRSGPPPSPLARGGAGRYQAPQAGD